ncbi:MAG: hypothetical protein MI755_16550 [Sphingomonadales bacterium]|nr:hypothetical protein [Sphingomonadales bacterium]
MLESLKDYLNAGSSEGKVTVVCLHELISILTRKGVLSGKDVALIVAAGNAEIDRQQKMNDLADKLG